MPKDTHNSPAPSQLWSALDDVRAGMLQTGSAPFVPMSHQADAASASLWFLTAFDTAIGEQTGALPSPATYIVSDASAGLYGTLTGQIRQVDDPARLDEMWSFVTSAWFDGKDDPDLCMLCLTLDRAEIWLTDGAARFLFDVARANVTGDAPSGGTHGTLTF